MLDLNAALVDYFQGQSGITDLTTTARIYVNTTPEKYDITDGSTLVFRTADSDEDDGEAPISEFLVEVECLGATDEAAMELWRALATLFRAMTPTTTSEATGAKRMWLATRTYGPEHHIDRETEWPVVLGEFKLLVEE